MPDRPATPRLSPIDQANVYSAFQVWSMKFFKKRRTAILPLLPEEAAHDALTKVVSSPGMSDTTARLIECTPRDMIALDQRIGIYVRGSIAHYFTDLLRKGGRQREVSSMLADDPTRQQYIRPTHEQYEEAELLEKLIEKNPTLRKDFDIVYDYYAEGFSGREIAERYGVGKSEPSNAAARLAKALLALIAVDN